MTSMQSDSESNVTNVSGYIRYNDKNIKNLYTSMIRNMEVLNQDLQEIERDMKLIISQAGPLEGQLSALLQALPRPDINLPNPNPNITTNETMDTD